MRYLLIALILSCYSIGVDAQNAPPNGEEVFGIFLSKMNMNLANESLCKADMKLYEQLALSLSVSYESKNITKVTSSCEPSKFDVTNNKVIDIWDCTIQINENSPEGEFVSSSTYVFGLSRGKHEFVDGSLRCR